MRAMTENEQVRHAGTIARVKTALRELTRARVVIDDDEDIRVAIARLEDWLAAYERTWVK